MQAFTLRTAAQLARLVVRLSCAVLCSAHAVVAAQANDDAGIDDAGFDDAGFAAAPVGSGTTLSAPEEPSPFRYAARLGLRGVLRLETDVPSRVASLRQTVDARLEWSKHLGSLHLRALASVHTEADFAYLADLQAYDSETIDTYAWQVRSGETYVSAAWPVFQVSTGLQIVNLGQGEMLSVLDVANPRDLREPLVTDAGDLRLPVLMTRMSLNFSRVRLEAIVIHEANFGLLAPPLGEFSPFRRLLLQNDSIGSALEGRSLRTRHSPDLDLGDIEATQAIGRFGVSLGSLDLAVLGGSVLDGLGVPHLPDPEAFDSDTIDFPMTHPRYSMVGHSGAWTFGAFVLRWEASLDFDRAITLRKTDTALQIWSAERHDVLRGLVGVTYVPSTVTSAAIEVTSAYLFDNPARDPERAVAPRFPVEQTDVALRFNQRFLSERAAFGALLMVFGVAPVNAWAARLDLAYAITDDFEVMLGVATYHPSNEFGFFYGFDRNDRVFLNLRWDVSG